MDRKKLLKSVIFLMFFIFGLDLLGRTLYWYFTLWYFDIITHFLGGMWVAFFFLYLLLRFNATSTTAKTLIGVFAIGILWEVFEYVVFNRIGAIPFNPFDTGLDIVVDMLGAGVAVLYASKKFIYEPER